MRRFYFFIHYTHFATKLLQFIIKLTLKKDQRQPLTSLFSFCFHYTHFAAKLLQFIIKVTATKY